MKTSPTNVFCMGFLAVMIGTGCSATSDTAGESIDSMESVESTEAVESTEGEHVESSAQALLAPATLVRQLAIRLYTGNDDKRADSSVTLRVNFNDGTSQIVVTAAGSATRFADRTWSPFTYISIPTKRSQNIRSIDVSWWPGCYFDSNCGDNWNLQGYEFWALDMNNQWVLHRKYVSALDTYPLTRFTGRVLVGSYGW